MSSFDFIVYSIGYIINFFSEISVLNLPDIVYSYVCQFYDLIDNLFKCEILDFAKWRPGTREDHKVMGVAPFGDSRRNIAFLRVMRMMPWSYYTMLLGSHCVPPWLIDAGLIANKFLTRGLHPTTFIDLHYFNVAIMEQTGYWTSLQNFYDLSSGAKPAYKAIMAATKDLDKKQYEEICIIAEKLLWQDGDWFWEEETTFYAADSERVKQAIRTLTKIVEAHLPEGSYVKFDPELVSRDPWERGQYEKALEIHRLKKKNFLYSFLYSLGGFKLCLFLLFSIGILLLMFSQAISFLVWRANKKKKNQVKEVVLYFPLPPVYLLPAPKKKTKKSNGGRRKLNIRKRKRFFNKSKKIMKTLFFKRRRK